MKNSSLDVSRPPLTKCYNIGTMAYSRLLSTPYGSHVEMVARNQTDIRTMDRHDNIHEFMAW